MQLVLVSIASVSCISLLSFLGVLAIRLNRQTMATVKFYLMALAAGAMMGNALFHLLPESFEHAESSLSVFGWLIAGFLGCFFLQRVIGFGCHHHNGGHCGEHEHAEDQSSSGHIHPTGWMSIISHGMDNFTDCALIGASYLVSMEVGLATTLAIILHEIPMELSGFGIMINAGFRRWTAIGVNFVSGLVAVTGTILTLWLGSAIEGFTEILTPVAAGTVIYIVGLGLLPQIVKEKCSTSRRIKQVAMIMFGLGLMIVASMFHPH